MPRIDCFDIIKNNPELVSEFISITEDMPEVEQRKQAIQIVNKLLEASNESLNKVKRKVGQKPQKYNSGVSQDAIDEIIKKYSQPEQKETPQAESTPALRDVESTAKDDKTYLSGGDEIKNFDWKNLEVNEGDLFRGVEENDILSAEIPMFSENPMVAIEYARAEKGAGKYIQMKNKFNENSKLQRFKLKNGAKVLDTTKSIDEVNELKRILGKKEIDEDDYKWRGGWKVWGHFDYLTKEQIQKLKESGYDAIKMDETDRDTGIGKVDGSSYAIINKDAIEVNSLKPKSESLLSKEQTPQASDVESYEGMFNPKKTGISGLDVLLKDDGYNYFYKSVSGEVVMMSPDEYLKKVREGLKTKEDANVTKDKKGAINEAINKGDKIYMPFISTKDGKFSQEGRNRAVVAKERGEKLIPVFIEKDISFDEKIAKGQEYINSAIKDGATTKEEVLSKLKEQGLHRDAIYFIDNNFEDKAVESLLSNEQTQTQPTVSASGLLKYKKKSIAERFSKGLDATSVMEGGEIYPDDVTQRAAWRSMGKKEFEGLLSGNEIGGDAKKGGYFGDNPAIASAQKGEGKYLVEFGGKKVEGETTVGKVSLKDITGVWKYENDKWNKLDKEAVESLLSKEQTPAKEVAPASKEQIESTAKALEEKAKTDEDAVFDLEGDANMYINDLVGKEMNNIISDLPYPDEVKSAIRKHFSITRNGEFFSSLGAERVIKNNDIERTKSFVKRIGAELLKQKFEESTKEYSNELDKLNENVNQYFQSLLDAEEKGENPRINNDISKIVNILYGVQSKYEQAEKNIPNNLSEAYHKAKADGSNPELVKAVESLLSKEQTPQAGSGDVGGEQPLKETPNEGKVNLSTSAPKQSITKKAFTALTTMLKKAFPKVEFIGEKEAREILGDKGIKVNEMRTSDGNVFGFEYKGKIFLDETAINADTPIHEVVGHYGMNIIDAMAKGGDEKAQAIIAKGFSLLQAPEGKAVLDEIKANPAYSNLSLMEKKMEALATIIGREGANMFAEGTRKNTFASKVKDFIKSFYDYIRTKVPTLKDKTIKQIVAMDNKEFIRAIVGDAFRGEIVQQNNESLSDDIRFSNDYESSPQFKKWKGNNRLVSGDEVQDVKTGEPIVVKGYHGTTNEFYEFDSSVKGNVEGHLGKVNYFTSDEQDASSNYQADGADITSRVSRRSEYLEDYLYDEFGIVARQSPPVKVSELDYKKISDEFNIPISDLKKQKSSELYKYIAEKELKGNTEKVLDLYIKLNNPVVLGSGATWFETLNISDKDLEQAAQEIADENGVTIEEAKEDYEWDIRDRAIENTGYKNVALDALSDALESNGYDGQLASNILGDNIYDAEINLNDLEKRMRKAELYDNNEGEMAGSQVISDFFKNLGFDGIILTDVSDRFKNMGLGSTTSHIHVFDEFKNQIKLADGTNTTFNPNTNDIRFQASPKTDLQEAERKLKEAWGKYLSNGISFDGMAEAEKERQLIVALLGYLKAKGIDIAKGIGNEVRDFIKNKFSGVTDEMIDVAQGRMLTDYQKLYDTHMTPKNKEILDGMVSQVKSGEMSFEDFINTIDGIVPNERIKNVFISYVNEQIDPLDGYVAVDEEIEESPESPKTETSKEEERAFIGGLLARPINSKNFPNIVGGNKTDDDVLKRITAVTQEDVQDRKVMVDTSYVRVALENIKEIALQNANALYMQFGEDWQTKVMDYLSDYLNAANPAQAIGILNVISTDVQQKIEKSQSPTERTKLFKLQDKADELSILFASQASLGINARKILRQFAQGGNMSKLVLDKILTEDTMQTIEEINRIAASKPTNEELNNATLPVQAPQTPKSRIQKIKQNVKAALSSKQKNKPKITEKEINELGRRAEEERKRQGVQTKMSRQQIAQMLKEEAKKC